MTVRPVGRWTYPGTSRPIDTREKIRRPYRRVLDWLDHSLDSVESAQ